jgi:hypothetical protein
MVKYTEAYKLVFFPGLLPLFFYARTYSFCFPSGIKRRKKKKEEKKMFPWCMKLRSCQRFIAGKVHSCVFNH